MKRKKGLLIALALLAAIGLLVWCTGGRMGGIFLGEYTVSPDGDAMTIQVGVASSIGYVRTLRERDDGNKKYITFYSTYGLNSAIGANGEFQIALPPSCEEIYFYSGEDGYKLKLRKDTDTGEWERAK